MNRMSEFVSVDEDGLYDLVYRYRIQMTDNVVNQSSLCQCSIRHHKYSASGLFTAARSFYSR